MPDEARSTVPHTELVKRLFHRLRQLYGSKLESMWTGTTADELVGTWAEELGPYTPLEMKDALDALRYACPEWPPTAYQFANLCKEAARSRRGSHAPALSVRYGAPDPQVIAEIHRLAESMRDPQRKRDPRDWARAILRDEAAGVYVGGAIGVRYAREALGIDPEVASSRARATGGAESCAQSNA